MFDGEKLNAISHLAGAVLALAGASSTVLQGAYLLVAYSAGLGVPFIITGFALLVLVGLSRLTRVWAALSARH